MSREQLTEKVVTDHYSQLSSRWNEALTQENFDAAIISAGEENFFFQDDQSPPFRPNPYLVQWLSPDYCSPGSLLLIRPGKKPAYLMNRPVDYWHAPVEIPSEQNKHLKIEVFDTEELLRKELQAELKSLRVAHIGTSPDKNDFAGSVNPERLVNRLHFTRASKTEFEVELMRKASVVGARGHNAAKTAFEAGGSEFDIHIAYLGASAQNESDLPYPNIIGINENAGLLHYQHQERDKPAQVNSLLIDAGGNYSGYASDITRSYSYESGETLFNDLLRAMQQHQDKLIDSIRIGGDYLKLHEQMHHQLTELLVETAIVRCSLDEASSLSISEFFCPHGLGHLLGIQVHDVGGLQINVKGETLSPPSNYSSLRFTRPIEKNQVFTIEPGIYFIPMLLQELKERKAPINWSAVEGLLSYGGIRIEDNVRVLEEGLENLTRDAFASIAKEH